MTNLMVKATSHLPKKILLAATMVPLRTGNAMVKGSYKWIMVTATSVPSWTTNATALECTFQKKETTTKEISLKIIGLDGVERFTRIKKSTGANGMKADITDWESSFIQMGELKTAGLKKINT